MKINTKYFGEIEVVEEKIIEFQEGIPGFEEEKKFVIINNPDSENPFDWLQAINDPNLSFAIVNPFIVFDDYDVRIPDSAIDKLKLENEKDIVIYTIVVVPEDVNKMTTNLLGPIVINSKERLGKQIILDDERYTTRHYIFSQNSEIGGE
ncbi:flagellar assembly protein FliW [Tissierella sp. MSJ-40]|uniref:Flagellar assembly factor FliW n=1 Tax=Tissierella simiarum TaxID=2841534 RepID=A0ABS6E2L1_9FIRM|nr:flagellar assembly protein FliW [Tissierella simiarum]MBU5436675.1 flagellar assembly protein FliW [Tissierella simiarum]